MRSARARKTQPTSTGDQRETPEWLVEECAKRWAGGAFDLDVAASVENAKAPHFYTAEMDGLVQPWRGRVWCNPPWSDIKPWVIIAREQSYTDVASVVVMLLPVRTGTEWWMIARQYAEGTHFIRGRVQFHSRTGSNSSNPEDCCIIVFRRPLVALRRSAEGGQQ